MARVSIETALPASSRTSVSSEIGAVTSSEPTSRGYHRRGSLRISQLLDRRGTIRAVLQNRYYGNPTDEIIEAPPCEKCGAERLACVMGVEQQSGPVDPIWYGWRLWCQNCEQFDGRWTVRFAFGRNRAGV